MLGYLSREAGIAASFALAALVGQPAAADKATLSTYSRWHGSTVSPFGCPFTTTYGQVITIPAGMHSLSKFRFWWSGAGNSGSMVVRGEVYAWDGGKAAGEALYESPPRTIAYSDSDFHAVTFRPGAVPVTPGTQVVLFASVDKDYERCTGYQLSWASVGGHAYPEGRFVFQNGNGDEDQWTAAPWADANIDTRFKAYLNP